MEIRDLQATIEATFGDRDRERGLPSSVAWLTEEVGELAQAIRKGTPEDQLHELGDVVAWVASIASQLGLDLEAALERYRTGCPRCGAAPCTC